MNHQIRKITYWCIAFIFANPIQAQDSDTLSQMSLEDLMHIQVETPSKKTEDIDNAPNVMYVVTKEEIRNKGFRTLKDVLLTIPGFNVFHRDLQFVGQVRGIAPNENEKMSFMINGHRINQITEPEILNGPINLDNVKRIEIIVGPGSVLYGPETLTSIINIITEKTGDTKLTLGIGNYNKRSGTFSTGKKWTEDRYMYASFTGMTRNGWNAFDSLPNGTNNIGKLYPSYSLFAEGSFDNWKMQFSSYNLSMPEMSIIHKSNNQAFGKRYGYHDKLVVSHHKQWNEELSWKINASYANKRMSRLQISSENSTKQESFDLHQKTYKGSFALRHQTPNNYFQSGLQVSAYQNRHNYLIKWTPDHPYDTSSTIHPLVEMKDHYNIGMYVSDEWQPAEFLTLTGAFRLDYNTILNKDHPFFSPRLAVILNPLNSWTSKLMYNQSVHMPSPWMSPLNNYWNQSNPNITQELRDYLENPLSKNPETLTAYEWENILYIRDTRISLNIYYQQLRDFIIWYRPFTNVGDFQGWGSEINVRSIINPHVTFWGNASYTNTNFNLTANKIDYTAAISESGPMHAVPSFTANAGVNLTSGNLSFNPRIRYFTNQRSKRCPECPGFSIKNRYYLDATIRWQNQYFDLLFIGQNLLNNTKEVSAQAFLYTYHPRGTTGEIVIHYKF